MKKRYRFLIILVVLAVGFYFLWPTVKWYFLTPQADKDVAESSRNQIKVYAQQRADDAIQRLLSLGEQTALPTEFSFLEKKAVVRYRTAKKTPPSTSDHPGCACRVHEPRRSRG